MTLSQPSPCIGSGVWHIINFVSMLQILNQRPDTKEVATTKVLTSTLVVHLSSPFQSSTGFLPVQQALKDHMNILKTVSMVWWSSSLQIRCWNIMNIIILLNMVGPTSMDETEKMSTKCNAIGLSKNCNLCKNITAGSKDSKDKGSKDSKVKGSKDKGSKDSKDKASKELKDKGLYFLLDAKCQRLNFLNQCLPSTLFPLGPHEFKGDQNESRSSACSTCPSCFLNQMPPKLTFPSGPLEVCFMLFLFFLLLLLFQLSLL